MKASYLGNEISGGGKDLIILPLILIAVLLFAWWWLKRAVEKAIPNPGKILADAGTAVVDTAIKVKDAVVETAVKEFDDTAAAAEAGAGRAPGSYADYVAGLPPVIAQTVWLGSAALPDKTAGDIASAGRDFGQVAKDIPFAGSNVRDVIVDNKEFVIAYGSNPMMMAVGAFSLWLNSKMGHKND